MKSSGTAARNSVSSRDSPPRCRGEGTGHGQPGLGEGEEQGTSARLNGGIARRKLVGPLQRRRIVGGTRSARGIALHRDETHLWGGKKARSELANQGERACDVFGRDRIVERRGRRRVRTDGAATRTAKATVCSGIRAWRRSTPAASYKNESQ